MAKKPTRGFDGPSQRQLKVGETLRRALAEIMLRGELHDDEISRASITVSEVRVTPDLRSAVVFVLPLGGFNSDAVLDALNRSKGEIRHLLGKKVPMKFSPDLNFQRDNSYDRMDEARRLLNTDRVRAYVEAPDRAPDEDDA